jgi:hypothetical protein
MPYIFLFLVFIILDGDNLLEGSKVFDLLTVAVLFAGFARYFPIRRAKLHFIPVVNPLTFIVFTLFFMLMLTSFWRSHNFLFSNIYNFKHTLITVMVAIVVYLGFQYNAVYQENFGERLVLAVIHVMGLFCLMNLISVIVNPTYGEAPSAILQGVGISTKRFKFPLYENIHSNSIGAVGGMLLVLSSGALVTLKVKKGFKRFAYIIYIIVGFAIAVIGDSRGTLFGAIICVAVMYMFVKTNKYSILRFSVLLLPLSHIFFMFVMQGLAESEAMSSISRNSSELATGNSRKFIYITANNELADIKPIHFIGYGEYGIYGAGLTIHYIHKFGELLPSEQVIISVAHNSAVQAIFDIGYIGLVIYILMLFLVFHQSQKLYKMGMPGFMIVSYFLLYHVITGISETYFGKYSKFSYYLLLYLAIVTFVSYNFEIYKQKKEALKN